MELKSTVHRCYYEINHAYESYFLIIDEQISRNLKDGQIQTRPVKSNGLWCFMLLPTVLVLYRLQHDVSPIYSLVTCLSVGLLFYCLLLQTFLFLSCMVLREAVPGGFAVSSLIGSLVIYITMGNGLLFAIAFAWPTMYLFSVVLKQFIMSCPKTFTIGEAMVVAQTVVLFAAWSVANLFFTSVGDTENELVNVTVYTVLYTVCLMVVALYFLEDSKRNMTYLSYIVGGGAVYCLTILHVVLGRTCIYDILHFVFMNQTRIHLFLFWLALTLCASFVLVIRTKLAVKADTVTRKTFHLLASMVFMSGILFDVHLTTMAAGIGLGVLILVEALRKSRIEPIASALHSAFLVYCDDKDCGTFAMTPLYMYCGLSCGLALTPAGALERMAGVLAVGVGDTAASWFGSRYGCYKWPGGTRTLEGTVFNILSQVATVYALQLFDLLSVKYALHRTVIAATVSGLVEAQTHQVDNLVLPLVTTIAFQITWFLQ